MNAQKQFSGTGTLDFNINDAHAEEAFISISGAFVGTFVTEGSTDGTNFVTLAMTPAVGGADVTSVTAAGAWRVNYSGFRLGRVRCSAYTSGTPTVAVGVTRKAAA